MMRQYGSEQTFSRLHGSNSLWKTVLNWCGFDDYQMAFVNKSTTWIIWRIQLSLVCGLIGLESHFR